MSAAFDWARKQALAYAYEGDPVGDWFEASLPGRQAFCMRDTAHQSAAAQFLGLGHHTRNMLRKFAINISDSKDWCSFWEINRHGLPAPVDYQDDAHFWYNLPANFDVLDACYRMFLWSGDRTYVTDPVFRNFYQKTVHDYVDRWDLSLDRIMSRPRIMNTRSPLDPEDRFRESRGIPSYEEAQSNFVVAIDQLAVQYAGYLAYSRLAQLAGEAGEAREFQARAEAVKSFVNGVWWNRKAGTFYSRLNLAHQLEGRDSNSSLLYYGAAEAGEKAASILDSVVQAIESKQQIGIEEQSHFPGVLYRYFKPEAAYGQILDLTRDDKPRREYPEVSYSVIEAVVNGLMGIEPDATETDASREEPQLATTPQLTSETQWAEVENLPLWTNQIRVRHDGLRKSTLENLSGPAFIWKACFVGSYPKLLINEKPFAATVVDKRGHTLSCTTIPAAPGNVQKVQAP